MFVCLHVLVDAGEAQRILADGQRRRSGAPRSRGDHEGRSGHARSAQHNCGHPTDAKREAVPAHERPGGTGRLHAMGADGRKDVHDEGTEEGEAMVMWSVARTSPSRRRATRRYPRRCGSRMCHQEGKRTREVEARRLAGRQRKYTTARPRAVRKGGAHQDRNGPRPRGGAGAGDRRSSCALHELLNRTKLLLRSCMCIIT